jgi:hypothetical protein
LQTFLDTLRGENNIQKSEKNDIKKFLQDMADDEENQETVSSYQNLEVLKVKHDISELDLETRHNNAKLIKTFHRSQVDILMKRRIVTECQKIEDNVYKERCTYLQNENKEGMYMN